MEYGQTHSCSIFTAAHSELAECLLHAVLPSECSIDVIISPRQADLARCFPLPFALFKLAIFQHLATTWEHQPLARRTSVICHAWEHSFTWNRMSSFKQDLNPRHIHFILVTSLVPGSLGSSTPKEPGYEAILFTCSASFTDLSFLRHTCMGLAGLMQQVVTWAVWRERECTTPREEALNTFTVHPEHTNNLLQRKGREGGGGGGGGRR